MDIEIRLNACDFITLTYRDHHKNYGNNSDTFTFTIETSSQAITDIKHEKKGSYSKLQFNVTGPIERSCLINCFETLGRLVGSSSSDEPVEPDNSCLL